MPTLIPTKTGWIVKEARAFGGDGKCPGSLILNADNDNKMKNYTIEQES